MASAADFKGVMITVFESQTSEVVLARQAPLAEHRSEVRSALSKLPPEVTQQLMSEYKEPSPMIFSQLENAIISRELAIENAGQEANLDKEWVAGGGPARNRISEEALGSEDEWNLE